MDEYIEFLLDNEDYQNALVLLNKTIDEPDEKNLNYLSYCHFNLGNFAEAMIFAKEMIDKYPENYIGYVRAAFACIKQNLFQECINYCTDGLKKKDHTILHDLMMKCMGIKKTPILLLSGFLGSGKTTLVNKIITKYPKTFVLVNDYAELGIDGQLIKTKDTNKIELNNGCICCNLMEPFINALEKIDTDNFDLIIVEPTGIAGSPMEIAINVEKLQKYQIVGIWTVQACDIIRDFVIESSKEGRIETKNEEDNKDISELIISQMEFCDLLLLNKTDLVNQEDLNKIGDFMKELCPKTNIINTQFCDFEMNIPSKKIELVKLVAETGWLSKIKDPRSESEIYNVNSMVISGNFGLDPVRFQDVLENRILKDECNVIRAKGFTYMEHNPELIIEISLANDNFGMGVSGKWGESKFARTDIVFIGINLDKEKIKHLIEYCKLR